MTLYIVVRSGWDKSILNLFYQFYPGSRDLQFYDIWQHQNLDVITTHILWIAMYALMMVNMDDRNMLA